MSMISSDNSGQPEQETQKTNHIRTVETLVDEHDYWMSITDAARVTRTSEAMVRRWVTSGRLPIKQEPVGINQRTRLVRASDVARLRPIIDPTAAITDDIRKVDLPSIPRQQIHIQQEHQRLLETLRILQEGMDHQVNDTHTRFEQLATGMQQQAETWEQQLSSQRDALLHALDLQLQRDAELAAQLREQSDELQHTKHELVAQERRYQQHIERLRAAVESRLDHIQTTIQATQTAVNYQLGKLDQDHRTQLDQVYQTLTTLLQQQADHTAQALHKMEELFAQEDQVHAQFQRELSAAQESLIFFQQEYTAQMKQQEREIKTVLEQHLVTERQEQMIYDERLHSVEQSVVQLTTRIEALFTQRQADQARLDRQDQCLQMLITMLQDQEPQP
jgi:hypothetical protein